MMYPGILYFYREVTGPAGALAVVVVFEIPHPEGFIQESDGINDFPLYEQAKAAAMLDLFEFPGVAGKP